MMTLALTRALTLTLTSALALPLPLPLPLPLALALTCAPVTRPRSCAAVMRVSYWLYAPGAAASFSFCWLLEAKPGVSAFASSHTILIDVLIRRRERSACQAAPLLLLTGVSGGSSGSGAWLGLGLGLG